MKLTPTTTRVAVGLLAAALPLSLAACTKGTSSSTGGESIHELRWITSSSARRIASATRGWLWPIVAQIWPAVKSRTRLPSSITMKEPDADLTRPGANGPP